MPTSTPVTINYSGLSDSIQLFSKISQIRTSFYDFSDTLLKDGHVYHGISEVEHNLILKDSAITLLFPVIAADNIIGFVICDATGVSQERAHLAKTYIESISNDTLGKLLHTHIKILNPLSAHSVSQMRKFALLFKPTLNRIDQQPATNCTHPLTIKKTSSIDDILAYVQSNIRNPISLESVSQNVFLSLSYLSRIFKRYLHVNFIDYVNYQRVAIACKYLMLTNNKVSVISRQVGCAQNSYFSKVFKRATGMSPLAYRRSHAAVQKVLTIPRDLTWNDQDTIFDISRRYFKQLNCDFSMQTTNGFPYVNQIGSLTDSGSRGWLYTVNCQQPTQASSDIVSANNAVIQWIYTSRVS